MGYDIPRAIAKVIADLDVLDSARLAILRASDARVFAAAGSTALGIEAALRDMPLGKSLCVHNLYEYSRLPDDLRRASPLVGLSMSGDSAEVLEILSRASLESKGSVLFSKRGAASYSGAQAVLGFEGIPRRFLPLAACLLTHRVEGSDFSGAPVEAIADVWSDWWKGLFALLAKAYQSRLIPIFISFEDKFPAELLSSQFMEYLKRPAYRLEFPAWTHDFLWTLGPGDGRRLAFIHLRPRQDLGDHRFSRCLERLRSLGISQIVLDRPPVEAISNSNSLLLARVLGFYLTLARDLGIDPEAEKSFE